MHGGSPDRGAGRPFPVAGSLVAAGGAQASGDWGGPLRDGSGPRSWDQVHSVS
ncbi:hypothetical protein PA103_3253 [Pseudomonas aeruginosa PA103]|nr:hypothetical protein CSC41_2225 [Pseudomonas aeruginosa]EYU05730.1 hypothetical protein PA103_3253 [Pseudomonas aeruginosa PA103]